MGVFSQIRPTLRRLFKETLFKGLRILSGNGEKRSEYRRDAPVLNDRLDDESSSTAPIEGNEKQRLSSNRLGRHQAR
jgi:hypothetical protein